MKKIITFYITFFIGMIATAQVSKPVIVEHFTNSRCGVCASKNPGLRQNLANHPDVLHISFHPSSPYSTCIFSQHNPVENDNRTKYYNIFGGTPWIVINGEVQPSGTNFSNPALFDPFYGQTSPFSLFIKEYRFEETNIQVEVTIKAVSQHSQEQALLFLGFAEDTVFYSAPNGESLHTDVFRKALTGIEGDPVALPAMGDSVKLSFDVSPDAAWDIDRMHTVAILQDPSSKSLLQARKTDLIEYMNPSFIVSQNHPDERLLVYPNPANATFITITDAPEDIFLFSSEGRLISKYARNPDQKTIIDISSLRNGLYLLKSGNKIARLTIVK